MGHARTCAPLAAQSLLCWLDDTLLGIEPPSALGTQSLLCWLNDTLLGNGPPRGVTARLRPRDFPISERMRPTALDGLNGDATMKDEWAEPTSGDAASSAWGAMRSPPSSGCGRETLHATRRREQAGGRDGVPHKRLAAYTRCEHLSGRGPTTNIQHT